MSDSSILSPQSEVHAIGLEHVLENNYRQGIEVLRSDTGDSYRYIKYVHREAVSALQLVKKKRARIARVANVYTTPHARRQGYATELFKYAKWDHDKIVHAKLKDRTDDGKAWVQYLKEYYI